MADRRAKRALFDALAEAAKALGSGRRAELVDVLAQGERSVEELATEIDQSLANTSQHLQRLLRAGLVTTRRDGTRIFYALAGDRVRDLWETLMAVADEHVADLDDLAAAYVGRREELEVMTRDELSRHLEDGDVVVVDVRPPAEYAAGHVAGALSIPLQELHARLAEIPVGTPVVAYCRGPYCVYADEAVRLLSDHDRPATRLEEGFVQWQRAGLPTATAADAT